MCRSASPEAIRPEATALKPEKSTVLFKPLPKSRRSASPNFRKFQVLFLQIFQECLKYLYDPWMLKRHHFRDSLPFGGLRVC